MPSEQTRELSSYAFNTYGGDARLYNGIHDLETRLETAEALVKRLREALEQDYFQSTGQFPRKKCGHPYYCTCPGDLVRAALAAEQKDAV